MSTASTDLEIVPGEEQEVTKLELFFDLIYVFAISQLSEHLLDNLGWRGALETLVLSLTVFGVWATTTYESTMVLARRRTVRYILLGVMVLGLVMNASITHAFEDSPWLFVGPLLTIQIGRTLLTRMVDILPAMRLHRINMLVWLLASAVPWVIGALVDEHARLAWWGAAAVIDLLGMRLRHPVPGLPVPGRDEIVFDVAHQVERCQLFLIICLGEGILTTGNAMIHRLQDPAALLTGMESMLVIIGIWALFFGSANEGHALVAASPADGGARTSRSAVMLGVLATNGQQVLVLGLVAFAVGAEVTVAEPTEPVRLAAALALFGGVIICVIAFWIVLASAAGRRLWISLAASNAALLGAAAAVVLTGLSGIAVMGLLLAILAITVWCFYREVGRVNR